VALTVTRAKVKERCSFTDSSYDATIDSILADTLPVLEFALDPVALADTGNTGLQATLNLAALEWVCSDVLGVVAREPGAAEGVKLFGFELFGRRVREDAADLRASAAARLRPYLKPNSGVLVLGLKGGAE
jgi:hypothetical protein